MERGSMLREYVDGVCGAWRECVRGCIVGCAEGYAMGSERVCGCGV